MASTRTPTSGVIKMSDLDKSITRGWTTPNANASLNKFEIADFFNGDPWVQYCGFAYCYGTPGTGTPHRLGDYYNIVGWVDYRAEAVNLTMFNPGGAIRVNINPMNGSNGTPPNMIQLDEGITIPFGGVAEEGAHWETLQFQVDVSGMGGGFFDVFFDGNYIDTITNDGVYVYDNGGVGYTNGAGDTVLITFIR
jgi:hypothetical protein